MTSDHIEKSAPSSRKQLHASLKAIATLILFAICTIIGYIIYETMLAAVSPQLLTVNTFFWLLAYFTLGNEDRRAAWIWRPVISKYVVRYAVSNLMYWYAFWIGLASGGAVVAL